MSMFWFAWFEWVKCEWLGNEYFECGIVLVYGLALEDKTHFGFYFWLSLWEGGGRVLILSGASDWCNVVNAWCILLAWGPLGWSVDRGGHLSKVRFCQGLGTNSFGSYLITVRDPIFLRTDTCRLRCTAVPYMRTCDSLSMKRKIGSRPYWQR